MSDTLEPARPMPLSLRHDARDSRLPRRPGAGFRNLFHEGEAPEEDRWAGRGCEENTAPMLSALARRMMRVRGARSESFEAGFTYFGQFTAHDMQFSSALAPDALPVPLRPFRHRRLMLETIYGEGPELDEAFYGEGADALAPWRLRVGRIGPGAPPGQRTLSWRAARRRMPGQPPARLCAADQSNDENMVVSRIAGLFMRLHNAALRRLDRYADGAQRFAAAQRVTQAVYRDILFNDLTPRLLRPDICGFYRGGGLVDRRGVENDDMPVEFSAAALRGGHALVRTDYAVSPSVNGGRGLNVRALISHTVRRSPEVFARGDAWPLAWDGFFGTGAQRAQGLGPHVNCFLAEAPGLLDKDHPRLRRAELIQRDVDACMTSGAQTVAAMSRRLRRVFGAGPGAEAWLLFNGAARRQAVLDWIDGDHALRGWARCLAEDPPLYFFLLLEAAAPGAAGGGDGRSYGALGSIIMAETLYAARRAGERLVEDHPDLAADRAAAFAQEEAPRDMRTLIDRLAA